MTARKKPNKNKKNVNYFPSGNNIYDKQVTAKRRSKKRTPEKSASVIDYPTEKHKGASGRTQKNGLSLFARLFASFAVALALLTLIILLPAFRLDHIEVTGTSDLAEEDIKNIISLETGRHAFLDLGPEFKKIFSFRYGDIETKLLRAYPELATAKASFSWPSGILISLQERVETACIRNGLRYALVDREGYIIRLVEEEPDYLPIIEGMTRFEELIPGSQLNEDELDMLTTATEITAQLILTDQAYPDEKSLVALTKSIRPQEHGFALLVLEFDNEITWRVKLSNDRSMPEDIRKLQELITSEALQEKGSGQLDLTTDKIVFRRDNP